MRRFIGHNHLTSRLPIVGAHAVNFLTLHNMSRFTSINNEGRNKKFTNRIYDRMAYLMLFLASATIITLNMARNRQEELTTSHRIPENFLDKKMTAHDKLAVTMVMIWSEINDDFPRVSKIEQRYHEEFLAMSIKDLSILITGYSDEAYSLLY